MSSISTNNKFLDHAIKKSLSKRLLTSENFDVAILFNLKNKNYDI